MWSTGIGSHPGDDARDYTEATRIVRGEVPDLAYVPELPGRGAPAGMTGRGCAVLAELAVDLQPAGWRLTDRVGLDQRRAQSLLAQDLDTVEEQFVGYEGVFKVQICGPWTMAATVERPRGDKVLADHGARRELAQSLAEGIGTHVRDVRRRVPLASRIVVQLDEPGLNAVAQGEVPTASGWGRHRTVQPPELSGALEVVAAQVVAAGAEPWLHSCGPAPWALVTGAGIRGVLPAAATLTAADHETLAQLLDDGGSVGWGLVPSVAPATAPTDGALTSQLLRWLEMVGLDPDEVSDRVGITPTCGFAGADAAWPRTALELARVAVRR